MQKVYYDFRRADLRGRDFGKEDLSYANFAWADLCGARLEEANLWKACFFQNDFTETCLDPSNEIEEVPRKLIQISGLTITGDTVYGWRTHASTKFMRYYCEDNVYTAPVFSTSRRPDHPGIYIAPEWWLRRWYPTEKRVAVACNIKDLLLAGGDKNPRWRARKIRVVCYLPVTQKGGKYE